MVFGISLAIHHGMCYTSALMAKVQFNCRLDRGVVEWIAEEAERRAIQLGKSVSQANVITLLVGSAQFADSDGARPRKLSKKAAHIESLKASDPMSSERPEIDYGSERLPSGGIGVEYRCCGSGRTENASVHGKLACGSQAIE